jgi:hypothetical protein
MLTHYSPDEAGKVANGAQVLTAIKKVTCRANQSLV